MTRYQFRLTIQDKGSKKTKTHIKCWNGPSEELARRSLLNIYFNKQKERIRKVELIPWENVTS